LLDFELKLSSKPHGPQHAQMIFVKTLFG